MKKKVFHISLSVGILAALLAICFFIFHIPDFWPQLLAIIASAFLGAGVTAWLTNTLLDNKQKSEEEKEKNIHMYQNKLDAFSEFSKELWSKTKTDYLDIERVRDLLFNKVIFFISKSDVDKLIEIFRKLPPKPSNVNKIKLFSELTEIIKGCLDNTQTDKDSPKGCFDQNDIETLWREIDKYIPKEDVSIVKKSQIEPDSAIQSTHIEHCENEPATPNGVINYDQAWHFAMLGDEQLGVIGDDKINELSLIEYEEEWRTDLLKQVSENDIVFLFRRGGYGYIGAFRPKGWRTFGYDDNEKLYETIHLFGEEEVIVKEEGLVNIDVEKYDIYGGIKDSADICSNLIVEPIYYLGHEAGTNPGGVYRRTISRYDAGYAATLLEWFMKHMDI